MSFTCFTTTITSLRKIFEFKFHSYEFIYIYINTLQATVSSHIRAFRSNVILGNFKVLASCPHEQLVEMRLLHNEKLVKCLPLDSVYKYLKVYSNKYKLRSKSKNYLVCCAISGRRKSSSVSPQCYGHSNYRCTSLHRLIFIF